MLSVAGLLCLLVAGAECWGAAVKVVTSAMDTQGRSHGIVYHDPLNTQSKHICILFCIVVMFANIPTASYLSSSCY